MYSYAPDCSLQLGVGSNIRLHPHGAASPAFLKAFLFICLFRPAEVDIKRNNKRKVHAEYRRSYILEDLGRLNIAASDMTVRLVAVQISYSGLNFIYYQQYLLSVNSTMKSMSLQWSEHRGNAAVHHTVYKQQQHGGLHITFTVLKQFMISYCYINTLTSMFGILPVCVCVFLHVKSSSCVSGVPFKVEHNAVNSGPDNSLHGKPLTSMLKLWSQQAEINPDLNPWWVNNYHCVCLTGGNEPAHFLYFQVLILADRLNSSKPATPHKIPLVVPYVPEKDSCKTFPCWRTLHQSDS